MYKSHVYFILNLNIFNIKNDFSLEEDHNMLNKKHLFSFFRYTFAEQEKLTAAAKQITPKIKLSLAIWNVAPTNIRSAASASHFDFLLFIFISSPA